MATDGPIGALDRLATAAKAGDETAFEELVDRVTPTLIRFFRRRSVSDAEHLAQETWLRVVKSLARYDDSRSFGTWIFTIAFRVHVDDIRTTKPSQPLPLEVASRESRTLNSTDALIRSLERCLEKLTAEQRTIIYLRYWEGFDLEEIADKLGVSYGSVKGKAHRAVDVLRKLMDQAET